MQFSLVGKVSKAHRFEYSWRDVVLYALGVGAKRAELDFLYEGTRAEGKRGPLVLPSFAVVPKFGPMIETLPIQKWTSPWWCTAEKGSNSCNPCHTKVSC